MTPHRYPLLICVMLLMCRLAGAQSGGVVTVSMPGDPVLWLPATGDALLQQTYPIHLSAEATTFTFAFGRLDVPLDGLDIRVDPPDAAEVTGITIAPNAGDTVRLDLAAPADRDASLIVTHPLRGIERRIAYAATINSGAATVDVTAKLVLCNKSKLAFSAAKLVLPGGHEVTTALPLNETFELPVYTNAGIPYEPVFIYDPPKYGGAVAALLRVPRDGDGAFASSPVVGGKVTFTSSGAPGAWIGEDTLPYLPPHEKVDLRIAALSDITVARRLVRSTQVDMKTDIRDKLVLYSLEDEVQLEVHNPRQVPVVVIVRDAIPGDWQMLNNSAPYAKPAADTVEFAVSLQPGEGRVISYVAKRTNIQP